MLEPIPSGKPALDSSCGGGWENGEKISRSSLSWRSRIPRQCHKTPCGVLDAWWMQGGINLT